VHHQVELLLVDLEHQLEFGAIGFAARSLVGVHLLDTTVLLGEGSKLVELVFSILPFVLG
jgi:hypothetical protein